MPETEPMSDSETQKDNSSDLFGGSFSTSEALKRIRKRLLDLTSRNRLLNFRWSKGRVLRIINTVPDDLYSKLIDEKTLTFVYVPDPPQNQYEQDGPNLRKPDVKKYAESLGINTGYELPTYSIKKSNHIQTLHYPEDMDVLLRKINQAARTAIEESGTNMLYIVFGFLEYYESNEAENPYYAPLLTLPVSLERGNIDDDTGYYQYDISYSGEDISDNITLREKLRQDFGMELPNLKEDDTPETYFGKISKLTGPRPKWKVRRQVTLTLLSFGKLLMYLDLDPSRWPKDKPLDKHPIIMDLTQGVQKEDCPDSSVYEYPIDEDPQVADFPIIFDADSSQHDVLIDALNSKNLVVEGPPGTGKSQTITNLIAAALNAGKTVLFVSEKLAALEVVRRRLDSAGLGMFCLELHSHKTQKKKLLEDISARIVGKGKFKDSTLLDNKLVELKLRRQRLKRYADVMNSVLHNNIDCTVHQVLWAAERHRSELKDKTMLLSGIEIGNATDCNTTDFTSMEERLSQFSRHLEEIGHYSQENPWYGFFPYEMIFGDEPVVANIFREVVCKADEITEEMERIKQETYLIPLYIQEMLNDLNSQVIQDIPGLTGNEAIDLLPDIYSDYAQTVVTSFEQKVNSLRTYVRAKEIEFFHRLKDPLKIEENDMVEAINSMKKADSLNEARTSIHIIAKRGEALVALGKDMGNALEFYNTTMSLVGFNVELTLPGVGLFNAVLKVASMAPLDLLDYRRTEFYDPSNHRIIKQASEKAADLKGFRSSLEGSFNLSILPSREEIFQAIRIFLSCKGLLRIFNKEWFVAKRLYKSICLKQKFFLRPEECAKNLTSLLNFIDTKAAFESQISYHQTMGNLFKGIETDFEHIEKVATWCRTANEILTPHASVGFSTDTFMVLSAEKITLLAYKAAEAEKHRHVIDGILPRLQSIFEESSVPAVLDPGNTALDVIQDRLLERGTTLMDMVKVFEVFIKSPESESPDEIIRLLETLQGVRNIRKELEIDNEVQRYLKHRHQGLDTDFATINPILSWCNDLRNSRLPSPVKDWLANPEASARLAELQSAISLLLPKWRGIREIVGKLDQFGTFKWHEWLNDSSKTAENISTRTNAALNHLDKLLVWADFSRALYHADKLGLSAITNLALDGSLNSRDVNSAFRYCFYNSIARKILRHSPDLVVFSGLSHEEVRKKFAELDRDIIHLTAERCIYHIDRMPVPQGNTGSRVVDYTNMYLLRHEIGKKTRHIPIRQLVSRASAALKALKPCFMMGPLSVAQYLERTLEFDIVVMDEASQVRPEESLGAIARGKQIVVVGDTKQLPPTTFFDRLLGETDDVEEEMPMEGLESILHICKTIYPSRILRWHYRSKHESLIAFSNRNFYDNRLVVFPSPHGHNKGLGLRFHYISNALYENRRNYEEAKQVVDAVINHSLECPDESLGVVTLNICQRDLIEEEVERRIKHYPEAEVFLEKWEKEFFPFFVKNLENVQGDERDVIFISTTFGRNPQGVVRQQFGPINQETGWRRLNVLFTRARRRVELFTSMQPEDIMVDHSSRRGVKALRDYILYVKQGILESPEYTEREPDSDFEISVADVLKDHGYAVVPQLGVANFFIDMAVKNPFNPGEFLAAIECDGATYHSARSVRERDRLRQQILENLGWKGKIYRIWSTDWFKDPRHQIRRLLEFLGHLQQKVQAEVPVRAATAFQTVTPAVHEDVIPGKTLCVEVGDFVTYCDMEKPDDRKAVQIVREHGDLNLGTIGVNVPLAQALLGAEIGDEVELNIPGRSKRMLRIIDIER